MTSRAIKFHQISTNVSMVDAGLDQEIRKSNVRSFVKKGTGSGKENDFSEPSNNNELESHLLSLKKSCSELVKDLKTKSQETEKLRDETMFAQQKSEKIKLNENKILEKIAELQECVNKVTLKKEEASHSSKTYENILQRMKKDEILLQLKKNTLESDIRSLLKIHNLKKTEHYSMCEFEQLSKAGLKDAYLEIKEQKSIRNGNLRSIEEEANQKIEKQKKLTQRQKETDEIQELAADDIKDADLIKLKKIMTIQLFVRQLLKSKMIKMKNYYEPFEQAFFKIKSNTKVKDAVTLKEEFENYDDTYNKQTQLVRHLEQQIETAEEQRKDLKNKVMEGKVCEMELEGPSKKVNANDINKKLLNTTSIECELVFERVQSWIKVQSKKMGISEEGHKNGENVLIKILSELDKTVKKEVIKAK